MFKNNKKTMKTLAFSLVLAALLLTSANLNAQNDGSRGLFGMGKSSANYDYNGKSEDGQSGAMTTQNFGESAPLGSGLLILLGAGLGYVALKKKEDEQ